MRLIDVETLELSEFFGSSIPRYAILSHCWGVEEVTFQDWQDLDKASRKRGFPKIQGACRQAKRDHYRWLWVDTNCIDKTSSAELTEAINSMYQWYAGAGICYAYLSDLGPSNDIKFRHSKWFTRGWTLQELVAPRKVAFYDVDWNFIGLKAENHMQQYSEVLREFGDAAWVTDAVNSETQSSSDFLQQISFATGISHEVLLNPESIRTQTVAQRMSWVSRRETTRVEDIAYCMLGLFDINMPLLYGEGMKAFMRLQEEIIKVSTDHSIFCWEWTASVPENWVGLLAPSPDTFASHDGSLCRSFQQRLTSQTERYRHLFNYSPIYSMTNAGLSIRLPVINTTAGYMICLNVGHVYDLPGASDMAYAFIPVGEYHYGGTLNIWRVPFPPRPTFMSPLPFRSPGHQPLLAFARPDALKTDDLRGTYAPKRPVGIYGLYVVNNLYPPGGSDSHVSKPKWTSGLRFSADTGIVGMDWREYPKSPVEGIVITLINIPQMDAQVLLAVREDQRGDPLWFCQIISPQYYIELRDIKMYRDLCHQVRRAQRPQEAHYDEKSDISAVISGDVHAGGTFQRLRVLIVSRGPRKAPGRGRRSCRR